MRDALIHKLRLTLSEGTPVFIFQAQTEPQSSDGISWRFWAFTSGLNEMFSFRPQTFRDVTLDLRHNKSNRLWGTPRKHLLIFCCTFQGPDGPGSEESRWSRLQAVPDLTILSPGGPRSDLSGSRLSRIRLPQNSVAKLWTWWMAESPDQFWRSPTDSCSV